MKKRTTLFKSSVATFLLASSLYGNTSIEHEFLSLLDEATTIATNTKVNIVHQPSTISVLNYDDIQRKGFKSIHEAIGSLPGFEGYITNIGWKELVVRGVYTANAYGFDKIKLLVDGVSINNALYGTVYYYLDLPIELVERIEVLRGPGSVLYGTGAFSGAINIITKRGGDKKDKVFMGADSYGYKVLGTKQHGKAGSFDIFLDGYFQKANKAIKGLPERRHTNNIPVPGETNEFLRDGSVGVVAQNQEITITSRFKKSKSGDYHGNYEYEFGVTEDSGYENSLFFVQGELNKDLENFHLNFKTGFKNYEFDSGLYDSPRQKLINRYSTKIREYLQDSRSLDRAGAEALTEELGMYDLINKTFSQHEKLGYFANESTTYVQTSLTKEIDNHILNIGISHEYVKNKDNYTTYNLKSDGEIRAMFAEIADGADPANYSFYYDQPADKKPYGFIGKGVNRTTNSVYLTDLVALNQSTDVSMGYRIDAYSDINREHPSYNIGLVHRKDKDLIFKLAHGSAFRAPSFIEIYSEAASDFRKGNVDLKPENIKTSEASILYKPNSETQFNATLFKSVLTDAIDLAIDCEDLNDEEKQYISCEETNSFSNYPKRTVKGVEIEYKQKINTANTFSLNYTQLRTLAKGWQPYITVDNKKDIPLVDISDELLNASHTYYHDKFLFFNTSLQYNSDRVQNSREKILPSAIIVDENINYRASKDMLIQFSVKNIFDKKQYNQSVWSFHDQGLLREGRHYTFKVLLDL